MQINKNLSLSHSKKNLIDASIQTHLLLFFLFSFFSVPVAVKLDNNNNAIPQVSTTDGYVYSQGKTGENASVGWEKSKNYNFEERTPG